jgi:hypothetical protein
VVAREGTHHGPLLRQLLDRLLQVGLRPLQLLGQLSLLREQQARRGGRSAWDNYAELPPVLPAVRELRRPARQVACADCWHALV